MDRSLGALAHEALTYSATGLPPGLPPGLAIGASGVISGTVASTGTAVLPKAYRVTLVAFRWQVSPLCQHSLADGVCPAA